MENNKKKKKAAAQPVLCAKLSSASLVFLRDSCAAKVCVGGLNKGRRRLRTGLCRIWVTLFFCSIMLKSCLRSGDMALLRRDSGSPPSTRSRGRVSEPAAGLTSTMLMLPLHPTSAKRRGVGEKQLASRLRCQGNGFVVSRPLCLGCGDSCNYSDGDTKKKKSVGDIVI